MHCMYHSTSLYSIRIHSVNVFHCSLLLNTCKLGTYIVTMKPVSVVEFKNMSPFSPIRPQTTPERGTLITQRYTNHPIQKQKTSKIS